MVFLCLKINEYATKHLPAGRQATNPNCFTYQTEELLIELLGGIRIEGLDSRRVTMKVTVVNRKHAGYLTHPELADLSVRHNLDLYNDTQVEKFVRRVAEKMETCLSAASKQYSSYKSCYGHNSPVRAVQAVPT